LIFNIKIKLNPFRVVFSDSKSKLNKITKSFFLNFIQKILNEYNKMTLEIKVDNRFCKLTFSMKSVVVFEAIFTKYTDYIYFTVVTS